MKVMRSKNTFDESIVIYHFISGFMMKVTSLQKYMNWPKFNPQVRRLAFHNFHRSPLRPPLTFQLLPHLCACSNVGNGKLLIGQKLKDCLLIYAAGGDLCSESTKNYVSLVCLFVYLWLTAWFKVCLLIIICFGGTSGLRRLLLGCW